MLPVLECAAGSRSQLLSAQSTAAIAPSWRSRPGRSSSAVVFWNASFPLTHSDSSQSRFPFRKWWTMTCKASGVSKNSLRATLTPSFAVGTRAAGAGIPSSRISIVQKSSAARFDADAGLSTTA